MYTVGQIIKITPTETNPRRKHVTELTVTITEVNEHFMTVELNAEDAKAPIFRGRDYLNFQFEDQGIPGFYPDWVIEANEEVAKPNENVRERDHIMTVELNAKLISLLEGNRIKIYPYMKADGDPDLRAAQIVSAFNDEMPSGVVIAINRRDMTKLREMLSGTLLEIATNKELFEHVYKHMPSMA